MVCNGMLMVIPVTVAVCGVKVGDSESSPEKGNWVGEICSDPLSP